VYLQRSHNAFHNLDESLSGDEKHVIEKRNSTGDRRAKHFTDENNLIQFS
jgi:hypothetical protein